MATLIALFTAADIENFPTSDLLSRRRLENSIEENSDDAILSHGVLGSDPWLLYCFSFSEANIFNSPLSLNRIALELPSAAPSLPLSE
jgi:hypothetical protein